MSRTLTTRNARLAPWIALAVLALTASFLAALAQTHPATLATQSSAVQGVTVKVSPRTLGQGGARWEFTVVLETHSGDLSDDLVQSASLTTGDGSTFKPTNWTGAGPGGHHREGVLAFDVLAPRPGPIELRIVRPGESTPRTFRW